MHEITVSRSPMYTRDHLMITIRPPVSPEYVPDLETEAAWFGIVYCTQQFYSCQPSANCSILFMDLGEDVCEDDLIESLFGLLEGTLK
jgi:hypothetical protein